jgi:hypothetical protein
MFVPIPDKTSVTGRTYEISKVDWSVRSISKKGVKKILKPNKKGQLTIAGERIAVYTIAKLVELIPKDWPEDLDGRDWDELPDADTATEMRYRMFRDGAGQSMNQQGKIVDMTATRNPDGYYTMRIYGTTGVHQLMGMTRFVLKPPEWQPDWSVDHIVQDPGNNHASNLVWKSPSDQRKNQRPAEQPRVDSYAVIGTALINLVLAGDYIVKTCDTVWFDNASFAAAAIAGSDPKRISACIRGVEDDHAGFSWKTPPSDIEYPNELFEGVGTNRVSERSLSNHGRVKFAFHNGYSKILTAAEMMSERQRREKDVYPDINIDGKIVSIHVKIVESFVGTFPKKIVVDGREQKLAVDHVDDVKGNARLGNLQLLTHQENVQKRHLKSYTTSVASFVDGELEKAHVTRAAAIESVKSEYPDASIEELDAAVLLTAHMNIPARLYGRTWIRARFETKL